MTLPDEVKRLLDAPNFVHLATLMPDGSPQIAPVWVGREGDRILAGRLRFGGALIGGDPAGLVFRNSHERLGWLLLQRKELDHQEAETMWSFARDEYQRCRNAHGTNCRDPGPPPR
jgi:pyridoxamine 5'-phosphate oxidase-like protein